MIGYIIGGAAVIGFLYSKKKQEEAQSAPVAPKITISANLTHKTDFTADSQSVKDNTALLATGPSIFNPPPVLTAPPGGGGGSSGGASTPGSGGTTGGGSAGGGGDLGGFGALGCPIEGTSIVPLGGGLDIHFEENSEWIGLLTENDHSLEASKSHLVYTRRGLVRLEKVTADDYVITEKGESKVALVQTFSKQAKKQVIEVKHGHLYWAGGILSHNLKKIGY